MTIIPGLPPQSSGKPGSDFRHQVVRDLAWCCTSPPLLATLPESDAHIHVNTNIRRDLDWLAQLDRNPEPLLLHLAQVKSTRLGIYYESLWHYYWQQHPEAQLLAHNLPLQKPKNDKDPGQTLGAFDFLVKMNDQYWHIENAVKFYLGVAENSQAPGRWQQWIGPNCKDRLDIKLEHLRQHQLPLSQHPLAQPLLHQLTGEDQVWHRALCLQGYLFYPALLPPATRISQPPASNPRHARGTWWHLKDFLRETQQGYSLALPRERWLSVAQTADIHELLSGESLRQLVQHWAGEREQPLMLAALRKDGEIWREHARSIVVPNHWPWTALPSRNT